MAEAAIAYRRAGATKMKLAPHHYHSSGCAVNPRALAFALVPFIGIAAFVVAVWSLLNG